MELCRYAVIYVIESMADSRLDTVVTPELFAQSLCQDFSIPPQHFFHKIVSAIRERVQEYRDQVLPNLAQTPNICRGALPPDEGNCGI